jgi:hypothetical protein
VVTELGLRFRPVATADQEDHQTGVWLLARDLADIDPRALKSAADEWARTERWMPKAADLRAVIARQQPKPDPNSPQNLQRLADKYNADPQFSSNVTWFVRGTELVCEHR